MEVVLAEKEKQQKTVRFTFWTNYLALVYFYYSSSNLILQRTKFGYGPKVIKLFSCSTHVAHKC